MYPGDCSAEREQRGALHLQRSVQLEGGSVTPQAPDTYLQPAVQTWEVTVGPKGGLEGMQEQGDVGAMGRMAGCAQLVGHGEELRLHLHWVQQQHGAGGTEEWLWALGAQPHTSHWCCAHRARLLTAQAAPEVSREGGGSRVPVPRGKFMVPECFQRPFKNGT